MNIKTTVLVAVIILCSSTFSHAQYQEITHRQTADEIKLFRNWTLKEQVLYLQQGGGSILYGVNYYDTGGRVIFIANPNHHEHFSYDDKGRMVYWLDSANDGRRFQKQEYWFGYDDKGAINMYKTSTTESKFTANGSETKEDVMRNGTVVERRIYTYNNDGKLIQELHNEMAKDSVGRLLYSHKLFYNKYGDLASEIIYNPLTDCKGDSTIVINTYDNKGKIIQKRKNIKTMKCGALPSAVERKMVSESTSYTYNAEGRLTKETMTASDPALSYRKEYEYEVNGVILKELGFDGKGKSTTDMAYSYIYYPVRKK